MTEIQIDLTGPGGPLPGPTDVVVALVAGERPGDPGHTEAGEIIFRTKHRTDSNGSLTLDLTPNEDIEPEGTYYVVTARQSRWTIEVPAEGPVDLGDTAIQVVAPVPPEWAPLQGEPGDINTDVIGQSVKVREEGDAYPKVEITGAGGTGEIMVGDGTIAPAIPIYGTLTYIYGGLVEQGTAAVAERRRVQAAAPSLGVNYTGAYLQVGGGASYSGSNYFTGPVTPSFAGDGVDVRYLVRPVSADVDSVYAEILTCVNGEDISAPNDRWETAVLWQGGRPLRFFEWIEEGETTEHDGLVSIGMVPNVWQECRDVLLFDDGDGNAVMTQYRRIYGGGESADDGDDTTVDDKVWRIVNRKTAAASSFLDATDLPWYCGINHQARTDVAWIEVRDGVDGTPILGVNAENATDAYTVPDDVQAGDWVAANDAEVIS